MCSDMGGPRSMFEQVSLNESTTENLKIKAGHSKYKCCYGHDHESSPVVTQLQFGTNSDHGESGTSELISQANLET